MASTQAVASKQHPALAEVLRVVQDLDPEAAEKMAPLGRIPNSVRRPVEFSSFVAVALSVLAKRVEELDEA